MVSYLRKFITHEAAKQCTKNMQGEDLMKTKTARQAIGTMYNFLQFYLRIITVNAVKLALRQPYRYVTDVYSLLNNY
jgi:hypothetical protein